MEKSPFGLEFDESRYFPTAGHEEVFARAAYAIEQRHPVAVLSGPAGMGKSLLLKRLARRARSSGRVPLSIESPIEDDELKARLAEQLGLPCWQRGSSLPTWYQIREQLRGIQMTDRQAVLLIDLCAGEPSLPSVSRLLSWARGEFLGAMTVLIASSERGSGVLLEADRFAMFRMELSAWTAEETAAFVRHRLTICRESTVRITHSALRTIADFSRGVPRDVLAICGLVWNAVKVDEITEIDADVVMAAVREWTAQPSTDGLHDMPFGPATIRHPGSQALHAAAAEYIVH